MSNIPDIDKDLLHRMMRVVHDLGGDSCAVLYFAEALVSSVAQQFSDGAAASTCPTCGLKVREDWERFDAHTKLVGIEQRLQTIRGKLGKD